MHGTQSHVLSGDDTMESPEYRVLWLSLTCAATCLVGLAIGLRLLVKYAIDSVIRSASHKQLLRDAQALREGRPLRAITDPGSANQKLIAAALNRV